MKKLITAMILLCLIASMQANDMLHKVLDNGLQVIIKRNTTNNSAAVYGFVKTGSKTEEQFLGAGISHYLEHLVSSGTTSKHTESEYMDIMKEYSLSANAYTTADMTAYHLVGEAVHTDTMIAMIGDYLQYCVFAQEEVDREREVILKEMVMRSTDPYSVVRNWETSKQYPMTNEKYPVIGYPELYKTISREDLLTYYKRHYIPNNAIFIVVGNVIPEQALAQVEKVLSDWERKVYEPVYSPEQGVYGGEFVYEKEFPLNNARVSMNYIIPEGYYWLSGELAAALDILTSKRTSALSFRLVEEEQLVNYIYGYAPAVPTMRGDNSAAIIFEPRDPADIDKIISIIDEELQKAAERGFTDKELENFLNREKASRILRELPADREANSLAWSEYYFNQPDMQSLEIKALESIKLEEMGQAISKILLPNLRVITKALPETEKTEESVFEMADSEYNLMMEKIAISDDVELLYRKEAHKDVVYFHLQLPVFEDWEGMDKAGINTMVNDLLLKGSKKYDSIEISEFLEDHVINLNSWISSTGLTVTVKCLTADLDDVLDIFIDGFNRPSFDQEEIDLWKNQTMASFQRNSADAGYSHRIFRSEMLYPNSRYGMKDDEIVDLQMKYSQKDLENAWEKFFKINGRSIIAINGDISKEKAIDITENLMKELRKGKVKAERHDFKIPDINEKYEQKYDFEQVNVNINVLGPKTDNPDFKVMTLINALLSRMDGGLHEATRGVNDLAYFASANYMTTEDKGYMRITSQTSINKKDQLIDVLISELDKMKDIEIDQAEIQQVLLNNKIMRRNYVSAPYIGRVSVQNELSGKGYDWYEKEMDELSGITAEDIQRVARKYFENKVVIVSYPSETFKRSIE